MNILIIGGGVVGTATALGFQRLGHRIQILDTNPNCLAAGMGFPVSEREVTIYPEVVLICVPEDKVGEAGYGFHRRVLGYKPAIYIRSSIPVGTCKRLQREFPARHFGHNPEFLREAVAEYEFLNPPGVILGDCCEEHGEIMHKLYEPFRVPIHHTTPEVSELTKLAVNGYLACQVSYWNQVKLLAGKLGVNSHRVGMLAAHCDDRVSVYGSRMHGRPYGGKCLPKDLEQLLASCKDHDSSSFLFEAIRDINNLMESVE